MVSCPKEIPVINGCNYSKAHDLLVVLFTVRYIHVLYIAGKAPSLFNEYWNIGPWRWLTIICYSQQDVMCVHIDGLYNYVDLQMAATFGKMLLEKNEQLQHELQQLQKAAEETMLENQVCIITCVLVNYE